MVQPDPNLKLFICRGLGSQSACSNERKPICTAFQDAESEDAYDEAEEGIARVFFFK